MIIINNNNNNNNNDDNDNDGNRNNNNSTDINNSNINNNDNNNNDNNDNSINNNNNNNNGNTNNNSSQRHLEDVDPKIYFKRYDLNTASVLDIIPDIGNSAIFEYDIVTNNIFTIGWCTEKSKESSPQRCMFKIDNITKNSKSSILTSPKLESIFELPQYYDLIMSGVSLSLIQI